MTLPPDASNIERLNYYRNNSYSELNNLKSHSIRDTLLAHKANKLEEDFKKFISKFDKVHANFNTEDFRNIQIFEGLPQSFIQISNLMNIDNFDLKNLDYSINRLIDYFESFSSLPSIIYQNTLTDEQFNIINSILNNIFESVINLQVYNELNPRKKQIVSQEIVRIYNIICKDTHHDKSNELTTSYNIINNELDDHYLKMQIGEIKDSHKILTQIKENKLKENTINLNNGYDIEANSISDEIEKLDTRILYTFLSIFITILLKIYFIIFVDIESKNLYIFISFLTLLISLSALITYFIKDRNRLITLQTHYKMTVLELSTMPEYMRELDSEQRNQLYIDLSANYFRGANRNPEPSENINSSQIEGITKSISDLTNLVSEIKGAIK